MPVTLAQAQRFTMDKLTGHIINEFRKDALLELIPFDNTVSMNGHTSLAYVYNRIDTPASASFRALNTEYAPQEADTREIKTELKIFGGSFQIDRVVQNSMPGIADMLTFQIGQKIEATKALFSDTFINGDSGSIPRGFDGIDKAVTGSSTEYIPANDIDLSDSTAISQNMHKFMDVLDNMLSEMSGEPHAILMNRKLKAVMNGIARRSGYFSTNDVDAFGRPVTKYAGIPLVTMGDKPSTSTPIIGIQNGKTSIYAVRFGLDNVHAISPRGSNLVETYFPDFRSSGAIKTGEVEMVAAIAVKASRGVGVLRGLKVV